VNEIIAYTAMAVYILIVAWILLGHPGVAPPPDAF